MATPVHLNIPDPCHENWQQMTPNEQGRHCMSCQKTVVDFTLMSDQQILDHISRATTSVCGRFNNDQLDKTYAEKKVRPAFSFRYAWNMVVATFLLTGNAAVAQTRKSDPPKEIVRGGNNTDKDKDIVFGGVAAVIIPDRRISGEILDDSTGQPVSFASIKVKGAKSGISADGSGSFNLVAPGKKGKVILVISAIGYETNEYELPVNNGNLYKIMVKPEAQTLKPVEVRSYSRVCRTDRVGGLRITTRVTKLERVKREINEWLPTKKDVRIYPNPVAPGSAFNISLNLDQTGEYKMELIDAAGRLVHIQALQVEQKSQLVNVPTQSTWSRGVYWLRLSKVGEKKVYQAKVLLQ
ncbi:T9SS C-terminal target domain-containing protein [Paraflavitalea soli]|uniref:T9SS C-terminal target domain-containing protein n=1 Tax=Paraflavitalea soli TaxID=2315862 RepID=A0A3B7MTW0_9BACT|nr:carboxypeptidase-like regulatory domain-containing protein [Paraflavitalea soli]AXY75065.1 T9SS C-terminal target domain-containing protein [Paraflavitalea soli]